MRNEKRKKRNVNEKIKNDDGGSKFFTLFVPFTCW
jgi:hypothetical protein